ncbi:methyltransferase domain-containing protein [Coprothermobacteraceae bacterium]|nr:methyltransferase domain-containing protein [Coprothermobacteraceae bacterium]
MLVYELSEFFPQLGYLLTEQGETTRVEFFLSEEQEIPLDIKERWPIEVVGVETNQWLDAFRKSFEGVETGGIRVVPPWLQKGGNEIVIYPGMAFGTGEHESTKLALNLLTRLDLLDRTVLDVGTGSGILAIYAAKAGAKKTRGIDIDPIALDNARENAALNNVVVDFEVADAYEITGRYDVVVANLVTDLLLDLKEVLLGCSGSFLILSGIPKEELHSVAQAYGRPSLVAIGCEWVSMLFVRGNA